ncbi:MAG: hypothetical protein ACREE7_06230, partial [Dongiaceae bacterium]
SSIARLSHLDWPRQFNWYGLAVDYDSFSVVSLAVFIAWGFVAIYRLMRVELQYRSWPWVWLAFVLFVMFYVTGFFYLPLQAAGSVVDWLIPPLLSALPLVYLALFAEPKDPVRYRWFLVVLRSGDWARTGTLLPQWLPTYLLVVAIGIAAMLLGGHVDSFYPDRALLRLPIAAPSLIVSILLFVLRDVMIVLWLNFGDRRRRADLAAVIYLLLLYGPAAAIARMLDLEFLVPFFAPTPHDNWLFAVLPPLLEVAVMLGLIRARWSGRPARRPAPLPA